MTQRVDTAAAFIDALNGRDADRLAEVLTPETEVATGRSVHTGTEAVRKWADKQYDHLTRRYAIVEYREDGDRVLALGNVQYVWTEGGEVADSTPIALTLDLDGDRLRRLTVHDDVRAALTAFDEAAT